MTGVYRRVRNRWQTTRLYRRLFRLVFRREPIYWIRYHDAGPIDLTPLDRSGEVRSKPSTDD